MVAKAVPEIIKRQREENQAVAKAAVSLKVAVAVEAKIERVARRQLILQEMQR